MRVIVESGSDASGPVPSSDWDRFGFSPKPITSDYEIGDCNGGDVSLDHEGKPESLDEAVEWYTLVHKPRRHGYF